MDNQSLEKLLYTIPEVVQATGYSRSFLYERLAAGELKAIRSGRTVRVGASDLAEWIEGLRAEQVT